MSAVYKTAVTLRFFGDDLDPDDLTARLGAQPTSCSRKGGTWKTSSGVEKPALRGSWRLESARRRPGDLSAQIRELLEPLTSDFSVWQDLASRFRADLFCGLFMQESNEGITIEPETLAMIGERSLLLDLDIYGPS